MLQEAILQLIDQLPDQAGCFQGSEYPQPVRSTFLGGKPLDIPLFRTKLVMEHADPVKDLLESILLAAEGIESVQDDKEKYFIFRHGTSRYAHVQTSLGSTIGPHAKASRLCMRISKSNHRCQRI